ncbi:MAG: adenylosuccinate lyase [Bacteroidetes bacterium]|nr:adenylosuccinate lyase [Bacteroidota bacterium]
MDLTPLTAISPVDGRYHSQTKELHQHFSEWGLIKFRVLVEIEYFIALSKMSLPQLKNLDPVTIDQLRRIINDFSVDDGEKVKELEKKTNHDVKAVEYYLKDKFKEIGLEDSAEFLHFGLTSQDINNTAIPLLLKQGLETNYWNKIEDIQKHLSASASLWKDIPLLARTHGQPASPTTLGKEIEVFYTRIEAQLNLVQAIPFTCKFGGATGNFNAHYAAYPDIDWKAFADQLVQNLGLKRSNPTTQIEHYDNLAALLDALKRINTILIDFCRDIWQYISLNYFTQKINEQEVGSSTMPHKVNPIDFENAEGNLGVANALYVHLSGKLPISRLQRDLTDSTVLRNIGVSIAHSIIAFNSILKGLNKLQLNQPAIQLDLNKNWAVVTEGIQTILRREKYPQPYEALKALTRNTSSITKETIVNFIDGLEISEKVKKELKSLTPHNYIGPST